MGSEMCIRDRDFAIAQKVKRIDITNLPTICYNDCSDAAHEPQVIGKTDDICKSDSAFMENLGVCEECITNNADSGSDQYSSRMLPTFAQWLNYCSDKVTSTTTQSATSTKMETTATSTQITTTTSTEASTAATITSTLATSTEASTTEATTTEASSTEATGTETTSAEETSTGDTITETATTQSNEESTATTGTEETSSADEATQSVTLITTTASGSVLSLIHI